MMFSKKTPAVLATIFIGIALSGTALACSTDGWDDAVNVVVGQPFDATPPDLDGVARFEELCALVAAGTGHVQTNSPAHSEVTNRFYVWPDVDPGAGDADILVGYSAQDGSGELFSIAYNGTDFVFTTSGGTDSAPAADGWNLIEYHWDGATFEYWLNADATTDAPTGSFGGGGAATLEAVRLGLPGGTGGFTGAFNFDSFEMHNTTPIGPLLNCDANADTAFNVFDLISAVAEINEEELAVGTPDCDFSGGAVNVFDLIEIVALINAQ